MRESSILQKHASQEVEGMMELENHHPVTSIRMIDLGYSIAIKIFKSIIDGK